MSAAEMREAAAKVARENWGRDGRTIAAMIKAIPLPDEEGMVERAARAIAAVYGLDDFAPFYEDARTVIRVINGGKP